MILDIYCEYARKNNINCCLSELMVECNKHYIIKVIHDEIPSGKCATFEVDYTDNLIKINLINAISLQREAYVIVELKHLYNASLIESSTCPFAYLVFKN
jgi:hypothetical protein